jgi:hypothetical protein
VFIVRDEVDRCRRRPHYITLINCPNCRHVGFASALPRVLVCSRCGQRALVTEGEPVRSPICMREGRIAQREGWEWDRSEQAGDQSEHRLKTALESKPLTNGSLDFESQREAHDGQL